jgi:hypothetical protein
MMGELQYRLSTDSLREGHLSVDTHNELKSPGLYLYNLNIKNGALTKQYQGKIMKN